MDRIEVQSRNFAVFPPVDIEEVLLNDTITCEVSCCKNINFRVILEVQLRTSWKLIDREDICVKISRLLFYVRDCR